MKTDIYTKTVLTIIAICLSIIVAKDLLINSTKNPAEAKYGIVPLNKDGKVEVAISNDTINVNLVEVNGYPVRNNKGKLIIDVR